MRSRSLLSLVSACIAGLAMCIVSAVLNQAFAHSPMAYGYEAISLDAIGHTVQLATAPIVDPAGSAFMAFGQRALTHEQFSNGHFGLYRGGSSPA